MRRLTLDGLGLSQEEREEVFREVQEAAEQSEMQLSEKDSAMWRFHEYRARRRTKTLAAELAMASVAGDQRCLPLAEFGVYAGGSIETTSA